MNRYVVDCSVAMSWVLIDERRDDTQDLLDGMADTELLAPAILPFEIANVLSLGVRRGRLDGSDVAVHLDLMAGLPFRIAPPPGLDGLSSLSAFALSLTLTAYDAAYLDLALREGVPLASLDARLRAAAEARGVAVLPG